MGNTFDSANKLRSKARGASPLENPISSASRGFIHPISGEVTHFVGQDGSMVTNPNEQGVSFSTWAAARADGSDSVVKARVAALVSPTDDGWSGLIFSQNIIPGPGGVGGYDDSNLQPNYMQFEHRWDSFYGSAVPIIYWWASSSTSITSGTRTVTLPTPYSATSVIEVGDAISLGGQIRQVSSKVGSVLTVGDSSAANWTASTSGTLGTGVFTLTQTEANGTTTGGASVTAGGTVVTGYGTEFTKELATGGRLGLANESHVIASIASDTQLTLANPHSTGATHQTCYTGGTRVSEWWVLLNGKRNLQLNTFVNDSETAFNALYGGLTIETPWQATITNSGRAAVFSVKNGGPANEAYWNFESQSTTYASPGIRIGGRGTGDGSWNAGGHTVDWLIGVNREGTANAGTNSLTFRDMLNGATRFYISAAGDVGIGNTAPASKLDVTGTVTATAFSGSTVSGTVGNFTAISTLAIEFGGDNSNTVTASGGVMSIEGVNLLTQTGTQTGITNKTFVAPVLGAATATSLVCATDGGGNIGNSGSNRFANVYATNQLKSFGSIENGTFGYYGVGGCTQIQSNSQGVLLLLDFNTGATFSRIQLGGTTTSFPAIKRNATAINIRLADDSADAPLTASNITASGTLAVTGASTFTGALTANGGAGIGTAATSTSFLAIVAGTTAKSQMNLAVSAAPTSPVDGDVWREDNTNTGLKIRVNGVTKTITLS